MTEDRQLVAGEIVGWRAWGVVVERRRVELVSLFSGATWPTDDWLRGRCNYRNTDIERPNGCDEIPGPCGTCGVHAARDRAQLADLRQYGDPNGVLYTRARPLTILGEVALAGLVIPGDRGWRASMARPLRLVVPYGEWRVAGALAEAYGVAVTLENTLSRPLGGTARGHRT